MVTFEQLLVKYLYQNKQISLQGFGTVALNHNIPDADMIHKNRQLPVEGVTFSYNTKTKTDESFVAFFSQQRGKIKPLAESDIESHLQLARQLMNIGTPYEIEGLGSFVMQKDGSVVLVPGHYAVLFTDSPNNPGRLKERIEQPEKKETETSSHAIGNTAKKVLLIIGVVISLGVAGWFLWTEFIAEKPAASTTPGIDSLNQQSMIPLMDTISQVQANPNDPLLWRAYFRTFSGKEKLDNMVRLYQKNGNVMAETTDSVNFRLYILVNSTVADTAAKVDSLNNVFLRPVSLERMVD